MTKQEYYDLLVKSALDGTMPGWDGRYCRYRTNDGHKCAIGVIIPDSQYDERLETILATTLFYMPDMRGVLTIEGLGLQGLCIIRNIHDRLAEQWDASQFIKMLNNSGLFDDIQLHKSA